MFKSFMKSKSISAPFGMDFRDVNKGRLPAFAGGNVLLAGGKISDRPVEISILANILLRLQFHLIYLAKKGEVTSLNSLYYPLEKHPRHGLNRGETKHMMNVLILIQ